MIESGSSSSLRRFIDAATAILLFAYIINYPPFIFNTYIPDIVRIVLEVVVIFCLIMNITIQKKIKLDVLLIVPLAGIFVMLLFTDNHTFRSLISLINKMVIFILLINLFRMNSILLRYSINVWVFLSYILAILTLITLLVYSADIVEFSDYLLWYTRYYLHNTVFGNLVMRSFIGIEVISIPGYMYEAVQSGFVFGINIIFAKLLIKDAKNRNKFVFINYLAALTTISTTLYLILVIYHVTKLVNSFNISIILKTIPWVILFLLLGYLIYFSGFFWGTSGPVRLQNMLIYFNVFMESSAHTLLFGNGYNFFFENKLVGIDSGYVKLLLEQGIIFMFFVIGAFYKYVNYNKYLVLYILIYGLSIPIFSYPLVYFAIALLYCSYSSKKLNYQIV